MIHLALLTFSLIIGSLFCYITSGHPLKKLLWPAVYMFAIFEGLYFMVWTMTRL